MSATLQQLKLTIDNSIIFLLPSETQLALIQTQPSLAITCLIPPRKQKILVDYFKGDYRSPTLVQTEVEMPSLLWTQLFMKWKKAHWDEKDCGCFRCSFKNSIELKHRNY